MRNYKSKTRKLYKRGGTVTPDTWDLEKGPKNITHISYVKKLPPDYIKQQQKDIIKSMKPINTKEIENFFRQGPPEQREQKDMAHEDIESYLHEFNKPMDQFGRGKKHKSHKRVTRKNKSRKTKSIKKHRKKY